MTDDIVKATVTFLAEQLSCSPAEIDLQENLNARGLDSLGLAELRSFLEDRFGVLIDDEEIDRVATAAQIVELVRGKAPSPA